MQTVGYREFLKALRELQRHATHGICVYEMNLPEQPIKLGINWPGIGTVPPEEAASFANNILELSRLINDFIYNGYMVDY